MKIKKKFDLEIPNQNGKKISVKYVLPNKKEREEIDKILKSIAEDKRPLSERKLKLVKNKKKILKKAS